MLEKKLNGVQKSSNRALNIGKNTRAPMEGIFRGVRPWEGAGPGNLFFPAPRGLVGPASPGGGGVWRGRRKNSHR